MSSKERTRMVTQQWVRDPNGPLLTKPPPKGVRTPNDLIWGHSLEDFMWIERIPNVAVLTIWSRSMIKEFNENYTEDEFFEPEPLPRRRRPWPVLRLRKAARAWVDPPLGAIDEGSDHEDDGLRRYRIIEDEGDEDGEDEDAACCCCATREEKPLFNHAAESQTVPNDPACPVMSPWGIPYGRLWAPDVRKDLELVLEMKKLPPVSLIVPPQEAKNGIKRAEAADKMGVVEVIIKEEVNPTDGSTRQLILGPVACAHPPGTHSRICRRAREVARDRASDTSLETAPQTDNVPVGTADVTMKVCETSTQEAEREDDVALEPEEPPTSFGSASAPPEDAAMQTDDVSPAAEGAGVKQTGDVSLGADDAQMQIDDIAPGAETTTPDPTSEDSLIQMEDDSSAAAVDAAMQVDDDPQADEMASAQVGGSAAVNPATAPALSEVEPAPAENTPMDIDDVCTDEAEGATPNEEVTDSSGAGEAGASMLAARAVPPQDSPIIVPDTVVEPTLKEEVLTPLENSDALPENKVKEAHVKKATPVNEKLYSTEDLPKLEEFIPESFFPDKLMVHKLEDYSDGPRESVRAYKRIFPELPKDEKQEENADEEERVAHLHLRGKDKLGDGNHSFVQRVPLTLPEPLTARSRSGQVTVAMKTGINLASARQHLRNEAKMYAAFPRHLMENWCGYNLVTPIKHPVPVGPVVPKFYGYYVPMNDEGECEDERYGGYDETYDRRLNNESSILLMEECGDPIEPETFTEDDRSECYSLILRLHYESFLQQSMYVRNVLVQPGPLTAPPDERSMSQPSFRVIDFGRSTSWPDFVGGKPSEETYTQKSSEWHDMVDREQQKAREQLAIKDWDY